MAYTFKSDVKFTPGGLDELLALDRYVVSTNNSNVIDVDDTVVVLVDKQKDIRKVGTVVHKGTNTFTIESREGDTYTVDAEMVSKPLEHTPQELWERWSYGAASVETDEKVRMVMLDRYRKLLDGFGYSPGGRIQLMLGQELRTGVKANLTGYNCFVLGTPQPSNVAVDQFINVLKAAHEEAMTMRVGGGVGFNISEIQTISGAGDIKIEFNLPVDHKDYDELQDKIKIGKFAHVHINDEKYGDFYSSLKYIVDDSIEGLFTAMIDMVKYAYERPSKPITLDFSRVRHRRAIVKGVNGRSSGAVSWMELFDLIVSLLKQDEIDAVDFAEVFSTVTNLIEQGGSRRGALMLILEMRRRGIVRKFITRKRTVGKLTGANISVGIDDAFMDQLDAGDEDATELWNLITESAWSSAEPGIVWLERCNAESNSWYFNPLVATNPCGEQPLPQYGVCNLGHIVLPRYAKGERIGQYKMDWDALEYAARTGLRFQDAVIDYTDYFLPQNRDVQLSERRVGMGTMGLGTLLILLGIKYGSPESVEFIDELYSKIAYWAYDESIKLASEKGSFAKFEYEKFIQSGFMKRLTKRYPDLLPKLKEHGIRNVTILTQAPTGSTGTMIDNLQGYDTSTGIEPYFSWSYWRASRGGGVTEQAVELVAKYRAENGLSDTDPLPDYFVTAMELTPEEHVRVQAACQKWVDSAISKTANAPSDYTVEDVDKLYRLGYKLGLKGITIYRDGSRQAQVLATNEEDAKLESHIEAEKIEEAKSGASADDTPQPKITKRPARLFGFTEKVRVPLNSDGKFGKVYITINVDADNGLPVEVFVNANDAELRSTGAALGRMTTQFLRFGCTQDNVEQAVKHLRKGEHMGTLPFVIASLLERVAYGKIAFPGVPQQKPKLALRECPKCNENTYDKGSCVCVSCGYSSCN
ncbi:adenosylcobalamin-dependent ribonucleoside-diphosphate reductase [Alicyclobacillus acidoterrestris]|uniref:Vitamin B12-dependent ribonucleotide reductase n=1 Tax=Alicyclobacillus acidoterrestris (strain ATCC 49025 / DSM 3922 / CIP 106132 / NCIMB 13137 / GD3B) TaxID=1356854 RepID=T0C3Z5_ALIAG|nr:adenosylcobalamin-dependent ribonucleoside-diphosphate reductase [Alicyclobacillus acidoterrestris]EPZ47734.1 hypothetical protein N007_05625 [Alicyclobacillus acidoterrestris ATCC 49025]UNO47958.1 adenosylcobalamin-dependent ribonucleoside-diphosphate reductase [Alicyclobacillus acidoterrestris]